MEFVRIHNKDENHFNESWELYNRNFPKEEKRDLNQQIKLFKEKQYNYVVLKDKNRFIGIALFWENKNFIFFEHLVILEEERRKGYATKVFKWLKTKQKQIIFEIELPTDEWRTIRLESFKKQGFVVNKYEYHQFNYREGDKKIKMLIMSYKDALNEKQYKQFIKYLVKKVYPKIKSNKI